MSMAGFASTAEADLPPSAAFATAHPSEAYEAVRFQYRKSVLHNSDMSELETMRLARMTYCLPLGGEWDADVSAKLEICAARMSSSP